MKKMADRQCKLSIVVPIYNTASYLRRCLDSLLPDLEDGQIEAILIDDGSTDGSDEIAREYADSVPEGIRLYRQENRGQGHARNAGIKAAKGDFFGFVDADDWIEPRMFSRMLEAAERSDADMVVCDYFKEYPSGKHERIDYIKTGADGIDPRLEKHALFGCGYSLWNKLVRKALFERLGLEFPEGMIFEDLAVVPQLVIESRRIVNVGEALYHYRMRASSTIHAGGAQMFDVFKALSIVTETIPDMFCEEREYLILGELAYYAMPRYCRSADRALYGVFALRCLAYIAKTCPQWTRNRYVLRASLPKRLYLAIVLHRPLVRVACLVPLIVKLLNRNEI